MKFLVDILALFFARLLLLPLELLPDSSALKLANIYSSLIFFLRPQLPAAARTNLKLAFPSMSQSERDQLFYKSKKILAGNILGFARIPTLSKEKAEAMCDYSKTGAVLDGLREEANGSGLLIVTMHFDAFEYFVQLHALLYRPAAILGRRSGLKYFDRWWNGRRESFGHHIFSRSGGYSEIVKRLKAGEDVIVLADQNVKSKHAVFVDFFGHKAATTKTIALAAMQSSAPVLVGSPLELEPGKVQVSTFVLDHPNQMTGNHSQKIERLSKEMNQAFETQIRKKPEAWFWIHRRWKTRPKGEPEDFYTSKT